MAKRLWNGYHCLKYMSIAVPASLTLSHATIIYLCTLNYWNGTGFKQINLNIQTESFQITVSCILKSEHHFYPGIKVDSNILNRGYRKWFYSFLKATIVN